MTAFLIFSEIYFYNFSMTVLCGVPKRFGFSSILCHQCDFQALEHYGALELFDALEHFDALENYDAFSSVMMSFSSLVF